MLIYNKSCVDPNILVTILEIKHESSMTLVKCMVSKVISIYNIAIIYWDDIDISFGVEKHKIYYHDIAIVK